MPQQCMNNTTLCRDVTYNIRQSLCIIYIGGESNPGLPRCYTIYVSSIQGDEFISEDEDDELIQIRRKRVNEFVNKCSRRP